MFTDGDTANLPELDDDSLVGDRMFARCDGCEGDSPQWVRLLDGCLVCDHHALVVWIAPEV